MSGRSKATSVRPRQRTRRGVDRIDELRPIAAHVLRVRERFPDRLDLA